MQNIDINVDALYSSLNTTLDNMICEINDNKNELSATQVIQSKQPVLLLFKYLLTKVEDYNTMVKMYDNLRHNFDTVVNQVLGSDYYNEGCDTYTCDEYCCRDIIRKKVKVLSKPKNTVPMYNVEKLLNNLLEQINKEYNKQQDIFNKNFKSESECISVDIYYKLSQSSYIMQELAWLSDNIKELIEQFRCLSK